MRIWEETVGRARQALRWNNLGGKILALAGLAVLVPLVAILASSRRGQPSVEAVAQALRSAGSEAARQVDTWLDARLSELRVAAGSFVVAENLARIRPGSEGGPALGRLRDHLASVRDRCTGCETLLIRDARGRAVTSNGGRITGMQISPDRLSGLGTADAFVGDVAWEGGAAMIVLAVPVRQADGRLLGALVGKINLRSLADLLAPGSSSSAGYVYLMTDQGRPVVGSAGTPEELMRARLSKPAVQALFDKEGSVVEYQRGDGRDVVGTLLRGGQLHLAVVAEMARDEALRRGGAPRASGGIGWIIVSLLAGVGLMAAGLVVIVVRPLRRLASAASRVAMGDLAFEALPTAVPGELGHVTKVFNTMVSRLRERESQGELERLSVTDALTGLYNRRHLMGTLSNEVQRSRRLRRTFSVLLADVDHFKQYNDTRGHLAGDAALVKIAETLRKMTRAVDSVARYGGEEFVVMLLETTIGTAAIVGERIRARVAAEEFEGGHMTLSVGAAEYPSHGDTPEELIASADAAMYRAKNGGRNRVVLAHQRESREPESREPESREPEPHDRRKGER